MTTLPDGRALKLRIRKEDADNVETLRGMRGINVLSRVHEVKDVVEQHS